MKISIITATYNSGITVRDTLESVLRQSYQDYELIIKDGGSKDDTLAICREYEPKFEGRLRILSSPDGGIYDAMNQGIATAKGDVIGILNSDDFYTSDDILQTVAEAFEKNEGIDAVYGDVIYVGKHNKEKVLRHYSSKKFRRRWMRFGFMPAHPSFYCKIERYEQCSCSKFRNGVVIKEYFDTDYAVAADFENHLRMIFIENIKTLYIQKNFVTMRKGGISSSGVKSHLQINRDHLRALRANGVYSNIFLLSLRYIYKIYELIKK